MDQHDVVVNKYGGEDRLALPPGFRFHPTDEELITHYLSKKAADDGFVTRAIGEADLNKCEPWDLPWRAKMGEKEWYFFCLKDRKYPTGLRTNRATDSGYWKATGKDKEIHRGKNLVGMKKTLVFYRGRAPKGEKTNWVIHEYRLDGDFSIAKNEWVICRLFHKGTAGKKAPMIVSPTAAARVVGSSLLPPLMDVAAAVPVPAHVTCFSNTTGDQKGHVELFTESFNSVFLSSTANLSDPSPSSWQATIYAPNLGNWHYPSSAASLAQLLQSNGCYGIRHSCNTSISQETGLTSDMNPEISSSIVSHNNNQEDPVPFDLPVPSSSVEPLQLDESLWSC